MSEHRILITGGSGFIGTNLVYYLIEKTDWEIVVLDNLTSGKKEYLEDINDSRFTFLKGDIRNLDDVKKAIINCDYVVNLAAQVGVVPSIKDPFYDFDVNVKGTLNLLDACNNNSRFNRFVQASSAAPLGNQEMPLNEEKIPAPLSPYGASKLACEGYCSAFSGAFNLKTVVLRFSNVYGPYCDHKKSVIPLFIGQILKNETLTIYGDGKQTRDFIHVNDICQGIYLSLISKFENNYNLFQLGTGKETSVNSLVDILQNIFTDKNISKRFISRRRGEVYRNYTDIKKAKKILDFKPTISIKEGLIETKKDI